MDNDYYIELQQKLRKKFGYTIDYFTKAEEEAKQQRHQQEKLTNPIGFWNMARDYWRGAKTIDQNLQGLSLAPYYLCCHSMELIYKAYLMNADPTTYSTEFIAKKIGHDLEKLFIYCHEEKYLEHIGDSDGFYMWVLVVNEYYKNKHFEYLLGGPKHIPDIQILIKGNGNLLLKVGKHIGADKQFPRGLEQELFT